MLHYDLLAPERPADGAPLIVLLHGRGASETDLRGLRPWLPAEALVVLPRAPFPGAPWGYGGGWAWYRYLSADRPEPESFRASQQALDAFLDALPSLMPVRPGPLVLGGFSQGGTMALAHALRHPDGAPPILNFSGFLADHPDVPVTAESAGRARIFWGHGTDDPAIPFELARKGWQRLRSAEALLEAREYSIGHWIEGEELTDARAWLTDRLAEMRGYPLEEGGSQ